MKLKRLVINFANIISKILNLSRLNSLSIMTLKNDVLKKVNFEEVLEDVIS